MSRVRVRGWWLLPLVVVAIFVMPWPTWMIEFGYTRLVYPRIQQVVTSASNLTSLAIMDIGLPLIGVFLLLVVWRLVRAGRERGWGSGFWEATRRIVRVAALLALAFVVCWGLNYRRVPLEETLRAGVSQPPTVEGLIALARHAAEAAGPLREAAMAESSEYADIAARLEPSFQAGLQRLGLPPMSVAGRPKVSHVLTPFFTAAGVTGMLNPVALESIVHPELLPFERPMVLAHEWAHLAGFADEADASGIAWLACVTGDPELAYSAHFFVVLETASALPPGEWRTIRATLAPGVIEDIAALRKRLLRQEPVVREAAFTVYDRYLKTNRVDDGVRSYSRVLRVLLTPPMLDVIKK
jgi:Protein of unknown function (DUF3810)